MKSPSSILRVGRALFIVAGVAAAVPFPAAVQNQLVLGPVSLASPGERAVVPRSDARTFPSLATMQDAYADDFAKKPGFGSGRLVFLPPQDLLTLNGQTYYFDAPDLLGLVDQPIAYHHLSVGGLSVAALSKKEIRSRLQRRPLTAAESQAVMELRAGQEIVTMPKPPDVLLMSGTLHSEQWLAVGALRAKAQCIQCHEVKEGTLLGAFSYTLVPTKTSAVTNSPVDNAITPPAAVGLSGVTVGREASSVLALTNARRWTVQFDLRSALGETLGVPSSARVNVSGDGFPVGPVRSTLWSPSIRPVSRSFGPPPALNPLLTDSSVGHRW